MVCSRILNKMRDVHESSLALPRPWVGCTQESDALDQALRAAKAPLLICDYDGTLAPFQDDKMQAVPYPGVAERLAAIAAGPTKLAFVSGRPVRELRLLLPLANHLELWGMHGREHRARDGRITLLEPSGPQREALNCAEQELVKAGLRDAIERKVASVALHWRVFAGHPGTVAELQERAHAIFSTYAGEHSLALLPFDGGLELRATDQTKGHAVAALLNGATSAAAAFLGDDTTDEDGFEVMRAQGGLALLVREPVRPSRAPFSLCPPDELLRFFDQWHSAIAAARSPAQPPVPVH